MSAWVSIKATLDQFIHAYKREQRRAIVMSLIAKRQGVNLDRYLTMDYEKLTEVLQKEIENATH